LSSDVKEAGADLQSMPWHYVAGADLQSVPLIMPVAFFVAGADLQSVPLALLGYNP
jgi:hypothetical protein